MKPNIKLVSRWDVRDRDTRIIFPSRTAQRMDCSAAAQVTTSISSHRYNQLVRRTTFSFFNIALPLFVNISFAPGDPSLFFSMSFAMPANARFLCYILLAVTALITIAKLAPLDGTKSHQHSTESISKSAQTLSCSHHIDGKAPVTHEEVTHEEVTHEEVTHEEVAQSPFAFVAFLAQNYQHKEFEDDNEDIYFYSTRLMGYQLMHNPETRSNTSIPFVVLATKGVSDRKKARLRKDGATVIVVDDVPLPTWISAPIDTWLDMMTKLRVFQQTQYEKIVLIDADVLVMRRLDGIFHDPATEIVPPLREKMREGDRIPLPATYMFAGATMGGGRDHDSETEQKYYASMAKYNELEQVNGGFFLASPSQAIFEYYTSSLNEQGRFDPYTMEQSLFNEAHRLDGPMPWKRIQYDWNINSPNFQDYENGAHAVHEKFWKSEYRTEEFGLKNLAALWDKARGEMEGYYRALEDPSPITRRVNADSR